MLRGKISWDGLVFLGLVALLVGLGAYYALSPGAAAALRDEGPWYGNWGTVAFAVLLACGVMIIAAHPGNAEVQMESPQPLHPAFTHSSYYCTTTERSTW